ncbi:hypothetical protein RRG08_011675 [Elysia crispata]|uniref:Uncharacterized protein n=1 Tax=Elysia crispata TaxID=231223 RepID=A0AAE0YKD5_9GAST|nr:hypothetical protein RRG08_011675 [Elysia crispata]
MGQEKEETSIELGKVSLNQRVVDRQKILTHLLKKYPEAKGCADLISVMKEDETTKNKILSISHQQGANVTFQISKTISTKEIDCMTIIDLLEKVVEIDQEEYHSPLQSAQMIVDFLDNNNNINPVLWFTVWRAVIRERFPKK